MLSRPITHINNGIRWMASYCTDSDGFQYVVVVAKDGYVYQVNWHPSELAPGYYPFADRLGESFGKSMVTIAGFCTPDDNNHHAVVGTKYVDANINEGKLHEFYYKLGELPNRSTEIGYNISGFQAHCGMASFYSPGDHFRHVVIIDSMGKLEDITWLSALHPVHHTIPVPFQVSQIASISGFLSHDDGNPNTRHIIVALKTGEVYDIDYPDEDHVPRTVGQNYVRTRFGEPVQNVTAFFSSDTNYRHIVVLTQANLLKDHAYDAQGGNLTRTLLTTSSPLANVADITSFYNDYDHLRHVLYATHDGDLVEITYTSQG